MAQVAALSSRFLANLREHGPLWTAVVSGRYVRKYGSAHARHQYLRRRAQLLHRWRPLSYSDVDPFVHRKIDPSTIEWIQRPVSHPRIELDSSDRFDMYENMGRVVPGSWDRAVDRWEDLSFYRGFREHFLDEVPWEETRFYRQLIDPHQELNARWQHSRWIRQKTDEELLAELREFDELYRAIRDEGYRSTSTLDELTVNIGRDGTLIHNNSGSHRLCMAKLLDLDEIPARILIRHRDWQAIRNDANRRGGIPHHLETHPDLLDVRGGRTGCDVV